MTLGRIDGKELSLSTGRSVSFSFPIAEAVECGAVTIVRLSIPEGQTLNENVYGVHESGRVLWQVSPRKHVYSDSPYTKIVMRDEKAVLFNWDGLEVTVDPGTGEVVQEEHGR